MEEIVDEAEQLSVLLSDKRMHRLTLVEQALPGELGDLVRQCALVEAIVTRPQQRPLCEVRSCERTDDERSGHFAPKDCGP